MEANAFLNAFINDVDQVSSTDGDYAALRTERLNNLIEVSQDFWDAFDWPFAYRDSGTATISSGTSSAVVPAVVSSLGLKGAVFRTSDGVQLDYVRPEIIKARQLDSGDRPSKPDEYSFFDIDVSGGTYREKVQTAVLSAAATLAFLSKAELPTLTDAATGEFLKIPERFQRSVIWPGMRALAKTSVGDKSYSHFQEDPIYKAALRRAIKAYQPGKDQPGQMPSFFGDR